MERVAVVKLSMNHRCNDGAGSFVIQGYAYASEVTDMIVASLWQNIYVLIEGKVWVKDDTEISC